METMKKLATCISLLLLLTSCHRQQVRAYDRGTFQTEVMLRTTPVADQGHNETCWIYAMLAVIETEHLMLGDSVHLSTDYVARAWLNREATRAFNRVGKDAEISMRGVAPMTLRLLSEEGAVPYDSYHSDSSDISAVARHVAQLSRLTGSLSDFRDKATRIMDERIGYLPKTIYMFGFQYTPLEFAHSVCRKEEYTALASTEQHPYGQAVDLELPDNQTHERFLNLPIDSLVSVTVRSLREGHPVLWEGDTSEKGFSFAQGVADIRNANKLDRQRELDTRRTTDDHCMAIVGMATTPKDGRRWFIVKNSWGTQNPYGGLMYISEDYFRLKTVALVVQTSMLL